MPSCKGHPATPHKQDRESSSWKNSTRRQQSQTGVLSRTHDRPATRPQSSPWSLVKRRICTTSRVLLPVARSWVRNQHWWERRKISTKLNCAFQNEDLDRGCLAAGARNRCPPTRDDAKTREELAPAYLPVAFVTEGRYFGQPAAAVPSNAQRELCPCSRLLALDTLSCDMHAYMRVELPEMKRVDRFIFFVVNCAGSTTRAFC